MVFDSECGDRYLVWTIHHALYDGWSMPLLLEQLEGAYAGTPIVSTVPFQGFVKYTTDLDQEATTHYWKTQLADCEAPPFPALASSTYQPQADRSLQQNIVDLRWPQKGITPSTLIRASWAIVASRQNGSEDVVFGAVSSGRQAAVAGIERITGPTIATVPVRVRFNSDAAVTDLLSSMQSQATDMVPHEQFGLPSIRKLGLGAELACQFHSLLVVQSKAEAVAGNDLSLLFSRDKLHAAPDLRDNIGRFNTYALAIVCQLGDQGMSAELSYDATVVPPAMANRLAQQFEQVLRQLCQPDLSGMRVGDIETISEQDLRQIWSWNATVPETVEACVHDLFAARAREQPDAPAICAWDGELTYSELDALSTRLAHHLAGLGAGPGTIVPLCFEKSMWTSVAMLGVMKAGAASVALDTTQPAGRLRTIVTQAFSNSQRQLIVSSVAGQELAAGLVSSAASHPQVVVAAEIWQEEQIINAEMSLFARATPQDMLYVVFTSGSTGTPKGAIITHANVSSAVRHQQASMGFRCNSRVFNFASYLFDGAWLDTLHTLAIGGCLCVPSDEARRSNIPKAIRETEANFIFLTPSVAQLVSPHEVPTLNSVMIGGEPVTALDIRNWEGLSSTLVVYGPTECTMISTVHRSPAQDVGNPSIGRGYGTVTWIVQPDGEKLVSIGEIGELWIEGPLVGQGYLADPEKTAKSFIKDPEWLVRGGSDSLGRRGRLYRTGDLVRYDADGLLHFVGRKDDQVKIRGQRVELGDVEHHLKQGLADDPDVGVVAEVIQPAESETKLLVAFLAMGPAMADIAALARLTAKVEASLSDQLPAHMVPGAYIPLDSLPMTATGKTDRRQLREMGAAMTLEQLAALNPARSRNGHRTAPTSKAERQLQELWAGVLCIRPESIAAEDSFLRIGGDSVAAMRLVSMARQSGLTLSISDIFRFPRLRDLATILHPALSTYAAPSPFSLLPAASTPSTLDQYLQAYHGQGVTLVDLLPITDFQNDCIQAATCMPLGSAYHFSLDFPCSVVPQRIVQLCQLMWQQFDILRAVFVQEGGAYLQAILHGVPLDLSVHENEHPDEFSRHWCAKDFQVLQLGRSFIRALLCSSPTSGSRLVLRLSHAQYDGLALAQIVQLFASGLQEEPPAPTVSFAGYMHQVQAQRHSARPYWQELLRESKLTQLPASPTDLHNSGHANQVLPTKQKIIVDPPKTNSTAASVFVATCALAISKVTGIRDVVFGLLVSGRSTLPGLLSDVVGPCINYIPIRVDTGAYATIQDLVAFIQDQMVASMKFELSQLSDIQSSMDWSPSTDFGFVVQFQNIDEHPGFPIAGKRTELQVLDLGRYGIRSEKRVVSILGTPKEEGWELEVAGRPCDDGVIASLMERMPEAIAAVRSERVA